MCGGSAPDRPTDLTRSPGSSRRGRSGSTFPRSTATGEASTTGCGCGLSTVPGSGVSLRWSRRPRRPTPTAISAGQCRWTRPSCALTNMRPERQRGAPADEPADRAVGRSRGGPSTEIYLAPMPDVGRWPSCSPLGRPVTHPLSLVSLSVFAFLVGENSPAPGRTRSFAMILES